MTPKEHQAEHIRLHRAFDELCACYLTETRRENGRGSVHDSIFQLMEWSHQKTMQPSPSPEQERVHDSRDAIQIGCDRDLIVLALAELALSRPGFEPAIREIVRIYDADCSLFDCFKQNNADRVKTTHGELGPALRAEHAG